MAKIPSDIVEGIKKLSEAHGTPVKSLVERLKQIKNTNENIKTMEKEDFKIRFAWAILLKETTASGNDFYIMPICHPRVREITSKGEKTQVGDITGLVQKISKNEEGKITLGEVQYASGTLWRDAADNLKLVEVGKIYKTSLIAKENNWGTTVTSNNTSFIQADFKMKLFKEFFNNEIKPLNPMITIEEMDVQKSETNTDIKIIKATITESDTRERPDGSVYGYYDITDESVIGTKNLRIFVDTKDVIYEQGSVVLFGGTIDIDDEGKIRWSHQFQIPTKDAERKDVIIKPPKSTVSEEIDLDIDLDEETKTETETKKEEVVEKEEVIEKKEPEETVDEDDLNFEV